jgi:hypothetical protein
LAYAANHLAIDKSSFWCAGQRQLEPAIWPYKANTEIPIALQHCTCIVLFATGLEDGKHAAPQQSVEAALAAGAKLVGFKF